MTNTIFSEIDNEFILAHHNEKTKREWMAFFGAAESTIYKHFKRLEVNYKTNQRVSELKKMNLDLDKFLKYHDIHNLEDCAKEFDVNVHTLSHHLCLKGIKVQKCMPFSETNEKFIRENCKKRKILDFCSERGLNQNEVRKYLRQNNLVFRKINKKIKKSKYSESKQVRLQKMDLLKEKDKITSANACKVIMCEPSRVNLKQYYDKYEIFQEFPFNQYKKVIVDLNKRAYKRNYSISPKALTYTTLFLTSNIKISNVMRLIDSNRDYTSVTIRNVLSRLFPKTVKEIKGKREFGRWTDVIKLKYQEQNKLREIKDEEN